MKVFKELSAKRELPLGCTSDELHFDEWYEIMRKAFKKEDDGESPESVKKFIDDYVAFYRRKNRRLNTPQKPKEEVIKDNMDALRNRLRRYR